MFKYKDEIIYIQMQKTGCTHITSILSSLFDGEIIGKHTPATADQLAPSSYVISSIRNPWDWYLSLWTYGVQNLGGLKEKLTNRFIKTAIKSVIRNPRDFSILVTELTRNTRQWHRVYDLNTNVESFRAWLKLMHDPKNSRYLHEGYRNPGLAKTCGFMTYRYLILCCLNIAKLQTSRTLPTFSDLTQFDNNNCYINYFVRQEALEESLCRAIEKIRPLKQQERERIFSSGRTNTSKRTLQITDYYDPESIALIQQRDKLLIEKFGYSFPG